MFFGGSGEEPLNIDCVRIIDERLNLENVNKPITFLDNVLSVKLNSYEPIVKNDDFRVILREIFDYNMSVDGNRKPAFHEFVYNTFDAFVKHKVETHLRLSKLDRCVKDKKLLGLIMHDLVEEDSEEELVLLTDESDRNMLKEEILRIFKYVKKIEINTTDYSRDYRGTVQYRLSLISLLNLIKYTSIIEVDIRALRDRKTKSWIAKLSESPAFEMIVKRYQEENYELDIYSHNFDTIQIRKKGIRYRPWASGI